MGANNGKQYGSEGELGGPWEGCWSSGGVVPAGEEVTGRGAPRRGPPLLGRDDPRPDPRHNLWAPAAPLKNTLNV